VSHHLDAMAVVAVPVAAVAIALAAAVTDFIVNSQGVFGFINQERVTLVLEFTHDAVAPAPPPPGSPPCIDAKTTPFNGPGGTPLSCAQLAQHCSDRQHGPAVTKTCPVTCGSCSVAVQAADGEEEEIEWRALDFM
jgi:hypothetical protein